MSFDWSEYLRLAIEISSSSLGSSLSPPKANAESKQRSAISRAYYASFILTRNYLIDYLHNKKPLYLPDLHTLQMLRSSDLSQKSKLHRSVRIYLKEYHPDPKFKDMGKDLDKLRIYRNNADYDDIFAENLEEKCKFALKTAEKIIAKLK
jgi:uncharacterized protein (UPF0332 family)